MPINLDVAEKNLFKTQAHYLSKDPVFPEADFAHLRNYLFSYIEALPAEIATGNFSNLGYRPRFIDWVNSPHILDLVESILGPDIILWSFGLCYKPAQSNVKVGLHADSHFWLSWGLLEPAEVLGMFISMTDMTKATGCLRVLPEVNLPVMYQHQAVDPKEKFFANEINDPRVNPEKLLDIEMPANRVCLLREHTVHGSGRNMSAHPRLGVTLRFISGATKYKAHPSEKRKLYLLRGANLAGNTCDDLQNLKPLGGFSWSQR